VIDLRPIFFVCGLLLTTLSAAMLVPALVDVVSGSAGWRVFVGSAAITLFIRMTLILTNRIGRSPMSVRQAFLLTSTSWMVIAVFGALPFAFSSLELSYTDAFFEAMSGITTTGSTVILGLDNTPPGILIWRSILQWLGGIGFIVTAVAILPMLQVGGMQLFRAESSEKSEKAMPRVAQIATGIALIYLAFTATISVALWLAGMTAFDAAAHAMTTIATGGFSTRDLSIAYYDSALVDAILICGMVAGGIPFALYLQAVRGRIWLLLGDSQVRWFLAILTCAISVLALANSILNGLPLLAAIRYSAFNAVSVMTGTGYATSDFSGWGPFANAAFFFLMFVGGCAGSTTCGVKVFRFQILYAAARAQIERLIQPHGVFVAYYNRRPISEQVMDSVMAFFFIYAVSFAALALALGIIGLDMITATSGAATAISNVGPGLGPTIGPAGTFATLPDAAKWVLSFGMLLGRLELFTVLVLFIPAFWRG